jgi:uncharacterized membrane protein YjgN (DUF898 family)
MPEFGGAAVESAPAMTARRYRVEFTGAGGEYFRIWIVNLLLTILTLGIYSAWAKVRKLQYFYRNTRLDGSVFDYHGKPIAILKGRIIALLLIGFYNFAFQFSLMLGIVAAAIFAGVLPWLLVQSQRFRLHNSSYRALRFRFIGPVREAYFIFGIPFVVFLGVGLVIGVAAGPRPNPAIMGIAGLLYLGVFLLFPYLHYRLKRYQHNFTYFGQARGHIRASLGGYYAVYGIALLIGLACVGAFAFLMFGAGMAAALGGQRGGAAAALVIMLLIFAFYGVLIGLGPFVMARIQNHVWNNTLLGLVGFESKVKARRLIFIVLTNIVLIILTLGLFTPFAAVRVAKYKLESMTVLSTTDLAGFVAQQSAAEVSATGEGAADLLDIDFAL